MNAGSVPEREGLFAGLLRAEPIVRNREVLRPAYVPEELPGRETLTHALGALLLTAFRGETPSNVLLTGAPGTGKTAVARHVGNELQKEAAERGAPLSFVYINCGLVSTQYRVLTHLANHFIQEWTKRVPFTGWPTDQVTGKLLDALDAQGGVIVIVLDEIDKLVFKAGDDVLYTLLDIAPRLTRARLCIVTIARDKKFLDYIAPHQRAAITHDTLHAKPYTPTQLLDILVQRAALALPQETAMDTDVLRLCAAKAEAGPEGATHALALLRTAADLAEREEASRLTSHHVQIAHAKLAMDRIESVVRTLPTQSKLVLLSTILGEEGGTKGLTTGEVYDTYRELCQEVHMDVLTQRRVTDLISELDMLGILQARVISKGRYGRTKEIQMSVPLDETKGVLREDPVLEPVTGHKPTRQRRLPE